MQAVILYGVIENGAELVVERFQINGRICFPVLVPGIDHLVLPGNHVFWLNLVDLPGPEIRQNFCPQDVLLGMPGVLLDPAFHIFGIKLYKAAEGHIQIGLCLAKLLSFPCLGFPFCRETAFLCLLLFSLPIRITIYGTPSISVSINSQLFISFLLL